MIKQDFIESIHGKGPLLRSFILDPVDHIGLRPNIIFELTDNKKVLHLGCTDHVDFIDTKIESGIFFHKQLTQVASKCLGIDINSEAVMHLKKHGIHNVMVKDITKAGIPEILEEQWDYIVLGEMLEHIGNPVDFIKSIGLNYKKNIAKVIISVPNGISLFNFNNAIRSGAEGINVDHKYWFTPYTLCHVTHLGGLEPENLWMCGYETMTDFLREFYEILSAKPLLLDTMVLESCWY